MHRTLVKRLVPLLVPLLLAGVPVSAGAQGLEPELRAELDLMRRRGELREALEALDDILDETPADGPTRALRARCRFDAGDHPGALEDAREAVVLLRDDGAAGELAAAVRVQAFVLLELGRAAEAVTALAEAGAALAPDRDPRDGWILGRALSATGARERAREAWTLAAETRGERTWQILLDQAKAQRALGRIRAAAQTLVGADELARGAGGSEPDVLVELGSVYFEAYSEVDDMVSRVHSPAELYREALSVHPTHEGALLGLFELGRFNWMRRRELPEDILAKLLAANPSSLGGLLARASAAIDDGQLPEAREALGRLETLAPGRRDVRTERAALEWIEHERAAARALLDELAAVDPGDGRPDREVGRHLLELYRFAEGLPFLERAVEREPGDWTAWRELGRALANTGDEDRAREALDRATTIAAGRRDAWRDNMVMVLDRMKKSFVEHRGDALSFAWLPDSAFVLQTYLEPFYAQAREELAARYGFTPGPVKIEVFRRWGDFSVRSTGFEGFPALGVCFGPVVTAVSPLSEELRGTFSWARTSYHEFTHVIHLGLSHNRCPRWVTEGLATWEEGRRNAAWWRNMRRDLIDAAANETILPVRQLNRAFRGPRVLFAYYQSGLLCQMLIEEHGFAPMVRLLEAFDRGLDLDQALFDVFQKTPEELDERFGRFVAERVAPLAIEPRWSPEHTFRLRFGLARRPPEDPTERARWVDDWCTVAWGYYWSEKRVDAEEALRRVEEAGPLPARALFLRAELDLSAQRAKEALASYAAAFAAGGEDFRARMAYGSLLQGSGDAEGAEAQFVAAERAFPGFEEPRLSAELRLAQIYEARDDTEAAMEARIRWLGFNAGDYPNRVLVADWLDGEGRHAEAERFWAEANEVDPFRRELHHRWGLTLRALARHEEALREFRVALRVPKELDPDATARGDDAAAAEQAARAWDALEPELRGLEALTLNALGRLDEARSAAQAALALDPDCAPAKEALERSP